jgi:2-polyprenyl-3-methyl-5-hydroxy-6-metoxy-1,4-benzoquinol methylase
MDHPIFCGASGTENMSFEPRQYWEERLEKHCDLEGVGCEGRSATLNQFLYRAKNRAMNRALSRLPLALTSSNLRMLDIGAGIGFWIDYFLAKGIKSITAVDIAPTAVKFLKEGYCRLETMDFVCADAGGDEFFKVIRSRFGLVIAMDVLYHIIDNEKFCATIRNIARVLEPGGYLFLTDILSSSKKLMSPQQHVHWRPLIAYKQELQKNGLDIIYLAPAYALLQSPVDADGVFSKLLNLFYYQITCRLTLKTASTPVIIQKSYLNVLYSLDSLLTFFPRFGVSTKLLVAQKQI